MIRRYQLVIEIDSTYDDPDAALEELQTAASEEEGIHVRTAGGSFEAAVVTVEEVDA